jgi:hypothetical protein
VLLIHAFVAWACAPAPPPGVRVDVLDEAALIVFDADSRTEHFIRRAHFDTSAPGAVDFGFLVPTPSVPTLAEAPADLFDRLARETAPDVIYDVERTFSLSWTGALFMPRSDDKAAPRGVQVIALQRVGAWDAAILQADDAPALRTWLTDHGYPVAANLEAWLAGYVGTGWALTAFKLAKDANGTDVDLAPVRLTFTTDRPFYPYREPAPEGPPRDGDRALRLWLVAPGVYKGLVGGAPWVAERSSAAPLRDLQLLDGVVDPPVGAWVSAWTDTQSPRPGGAELTFQAAPAVELRPPPTREVRTEDVPIPVDLLAGVGLTGLLLRRRFTRRA